MERYMILILDSCIYVPDGSVLVMTKTYLPIPFPKYEHQFYAMVLSCPGVSYNHPQSFLICLQIYIYTIPLNSDCIFLINCPLDHF